MGVSQDLQGHHQDAQSYYRSALDLQPDDAGVRNNLGLSLALNGHPREAINVLLDIATSANAPPQARQNLALAYGLDGNYAAAESILSAEGDRTVVQNNMEYYHFLQSRLAEGGTQ